MSCSRKEQSSFKSMGEWLGKVWGPTSWHGEFPGNTSWTLQPPPPIQPSQESVPAGRPSRGGQTRTSWTHNCPLVIQAMQRVASGGRCYLRMVVEACLKRRWSRALQEVRGPPQLLGEEHSRKRSIPESVQRSRGRHMMGLFKHLKASVDGMEGGVQAQASSLRDGLRDGPLRDGLIPQGWGIWLLPVELSGLGMVLIMVLWDLSSCGEWNTTVVGGYFYRQWNEVLACDRIQMNDHCLYDLHYFHDYFPQIWWRLAAQAELISPQPPQQPLWPGHLGRSPWQLLISTLALSFLPILCLFPWQLVPAFSYYSLHALLQGSSSCGREGVGGGTGCDESLSRVPHFATWTWRSGLWW